MRAAFAPSAMSAMTSTVSQSASLIFVPYFHFYFSDYIYVSQGKTKVDSIDDDEELLYTEDAFNVLGFAPDEKFDCYVLTAGVMTCGGIIYETKGRDDQAEM